MGEYTRRAVLGVIGGAGATFGATTLKRDPLTSGGGVAYDDPIFEIPDGERYAPDGEDYDAIRFHQGAGFALVNGSTLTLEWGGA